MRRVIIAVLVGSALASACGTGASGPVVLPTEDLPFDISRSLESADPLTATTRREISFIRRGRLATVARRIATDVSPQEALLRALLDGPTGREIERGIQTLIPDTTRLLDVEIVDGITAVDLSSEFQTAAPSETIVLRIAQVVWTITDTPGVLGVRFLIDGVPVTPVNGDGIQVDRPVTRGDYTNLAPR